MKKQFGVIVSLALLTACVSPEPYRFASDILQPNTRLTADGSVSIDVLGLARSEHCAIARVPESEISARFVHVGLRNDPALRIRFANGYFADFAKGGTRSKIGMQSALRSDILRWLKASRFDGCLSIPSSATDGHAIVERIARQVYAQRPMAASEAVFSWYGTGVANDDWISPSRLVLLRPGMEVCAHDVIEPDGNRRGEAAANIWAAGDSGQSLGDATRQAQGTRRPAAETSRIFATGGTICSWIADGPGGAQFSPSVGLLDTPLIGPDWDDATKYKQVTSWDEVQRRTIAGRPYIFAIIHAAELPPTMPAPGDGYYTINGSFLVRLDPSKPVKLALSECTDAEGKSTDQCRGIEALQLATRGGVESKLCDPSNAAAVTCIAFGRRATFTASFPVTVNGARAMVPVGARLATIAAQVAPDFLGPESATADSAALDGADATRQARSFAKLKLYRWFEGRRVRVRLTGDVANFPLQPGDIISW